MSTIIENISVQPVLSSVVLGIDTNKKAATSNTSYSAYAPTLRKWYRQSTEKLSYFDWDTNKNELEFE